MDKLNYNKNRNLIVTAIEVTRQSKVPMLFLSNPGLGKTTVINRWAEKNNYHVETLIGSSFDRAEVLGYMVNTGKDHLEVLEPQWYHSIMENEKNKIPSVLFIDEISTAPTDVQGSLYRLIFERTIGNGKQLPEDCVILSAANYKDNLPSYFEISAPALNRFCLINLMPKTSNDLVYEYLQDEKDQFANWPEFKVNPLNDSSKEMLTSSVINLFSSIFENYCNTGDSSKGIINLDNKTLNNLYEGVPTKQHEVYNFISGRSMSYFKRCLQAYIELGINKTDIFLTQMIEGLIGAGTNNFKNDSEVKNYIASVKAAVQEIISSIKVGSIKVDDAPIYNDDDSVAEKVKKFLQNNDKTSLLQVGKQHDNLVKLYANICNSYNSNNIMTTIDKLTDNDVNVNIANFAADYNAIEEFIEYLNGMQTKGDDVDKMKSSLEDIGLNMKFYATSSTGTKK